MCSLCVYVVWGLLWGVGESILTTDGGSKSAITNGSESELASQESNQRSTVYGEYYPEDIHSSSNYGYGYEHHGNYQPYPYHDSHHHDHYDIGLKTLLIPLAGVALLGAAALFASNPILLQLGVVSGKRRRRSVPEGWPIEEQRFQDILLLEKFISQLPKEEVVREERRLLASHFQCSDTLCVDRLACELHSTRAIDHMTERHLMDMVISEIVNNEFISEELKKSIIRARKVGQIGGDCNTFPCAELGNRTQVLKQ